MINLRESLRNTLNIQDISEEKYRNLPYLSYSLLSKLDDDPRQAKAILDGKKPEPTDAMKDGTLLDILCFSNEEELHETYEIADIIKPSDKLVDISNVLLQQFPDTFLQDISNENLVTVGRHFKYNNKQLDHTLANTIRNGLTGYHNAIIKADDKTVISTEKYNDFLTIKNVLQSHEFTSVYFEKGVHDGYEVHFQVPMTSLVDMKDTEGVIKGLFDIVLIDHNEKTIQIVDLKKDSIGKFRSSFYSFNYYLQGAMYYFIARSNNLTDYKVLNPLYIVANIKDPYRPGVYKMSDNDISAGLYSGHFSSNPNARVKGMYELIEDYYWHVKNDKWDYPVEVYRSNGIIDLDKLEPDNDTQNKSKPNKS